VAYVPHVRPNLPDSPLPGYQLSGVLPGHWSEAAPGVRPAQCHQLEFELGGEGPENRVSEKQQL